MYRYEDNSVDRYEKDAYFVALQINESDAYFVALQIRFHTDVIEKDAIFRHLSAKNSAMEGQHHYPLQSIVVL